MTFKKGRTPWNKGKKGMQIPWNKGKKGMQIPWNKGLTKETDERVKEYGQKVSKTKKGNIPWNKGIPRSEETKRKIRESKKGNHSPGEFKKGHKFNIKENHPQWRGGISFEPYGIEFNKKLREQIRKRDNYRCQQCFRHQNELFYKSGRKYKLNVHHIDYNKKNNHPKNLISLCRNCHAYTNFTRVNWTNHFQKVIRNSIYSNA